MWLQFSKLSIVAGSRKIIFRRLYEPPSSGGTGEGSQVECARLTPNWPSGPSLYNSMGMKPDLSNGPTIVGSPLSLCWLDTVADPHIRVSRSGAAEDAVYLRCNAELCGDWLKAVPMTQCNIRFIWDVTLSCVATGSRPSLWHNVTFGLSGM